MLITLLLSILVPCVAPAAPEPGDSGSPQGQVLLYRPGEPPSTAYPDLRAAIDSAADGDTLVLLPGVYRGPENRDLLVTKDLVFLGQDVLGAVVIDCEGAGRAFDLVDARVGFGGIVFCNGEAPSELGGAIRFQGGQVAIERCRFEGSSASEGGAAGGIGQMVIRASAFRDNQALNGGAVWLEGGGTIEDCLFEGNAAIGNGGALGFISTPPSPTVTMRSCVLRRNAAGRTGGAVAFLVSAAARLEGCLMEENRADSLGGGLGVGLLPAFGFVTLFDSVIRANAAVDGGGGVYGPVGVLNCTIVENTTPAPVGAGVYGGTTSAPAVVVNSILRDNVSTAPLLADQQASGIGGLFNLPQIDLLHCNIEGFAGPPPNFDADPLFRNAGGGDYSLLAGSACIDVGLTLGLQGTAIDFAGRPRVRGRAVDVGANEFSSAPTSRAESASSRQRTPPGPASCGASSTASTGPPDQTPSRSPVS